MASFFCITWSIRLVPSNELSSDERDFESCSLLRAGDPFPEGSRTQDIRLPVPKAIPLRVQSIQIWSIYGFCIRSRNYGLWYIHHIWVLEGAHGRFQPLPGP